MSAAGAAAAFLAGAVISLAVSWLLVSRLERGRGAPGSVRGPARPGGGARGGRARGHRGRHRDVRWLGTFLEDPLDVPGEVLDFVAGQLGIADPSVVKQYAERVKTKFDHQQEIRRKYGLRDFADAEAELAGWVAARAWTSGDGPKAIFLDAMTWLREPTVWWSC